MRKKFAAASLSVLLTVSMIPTMAVSAAVRPEATTDKDLQNAEYAPNEVVVVYDDGAVTTDAPSTSAEKKRASNAKTAKSFGSSMGAASTEDKKKAKNTLDDQQPILSESLKNAYTLEDTIVFEGEGEDEMIVSVVSSESLTTEQMVTKLEANDAVKYVEPNYIVKALDVDYNDPYNDMSWQLSDSGINASKGWEAYEQQADASSESVVVAVIDTGIDYSHEDLKGRMWTAPAKFKLSGTHGFDFVDGENDPMDENGHGSHCAGIIAAEADNAKGFAGVSGKANVELMALRVLDADGYGNLDDILNAFYYVKSAKELGVNIKACSISLGGSFTSDIYDDVIDEVGEAGVLTIAAAGNESANNDKVPSAPANSNSDYIVSVAATDEDGSLASYSNYGKKTVDVAAPGSNIVSSVSYANYIPYLTDAATIQRTTAFYGEFDGATVAADGSVTPITGTDLNGNAISGVKTFGASVMAEKKIAGSNGTATLSIDSTSAGKFTPANNNSSLRWEIKNAKAGDTYVLYFPYAKPATDGSDQYLNAVIREDIDSDSANGALAVGDIVVNTDTDGNLSYTVATDYDGEAYAYRVDSSMKSIWIGSGSDYQLLPYTVVKGVKNNSATAKTTDSAVATDDSADASVEADDRVSEAGDALEAPSGDVDADGEDQDSATEDAEAKADAASEESGETEGAFTAKSNGVVAQDADGDAPISNEGGETNVVTTGYGVGLLFSVGSDGDAAFEINNISISKTDLAEEDLLYYDLYSGTSMATPVVSGTVALLAAMYPDASAMDLKHMLLEMTDDQFLGKVSSGGKIDFDEFEATGTESSQRKPVVDSAEVDFESGTVLLKGENFGKNPAVSFVRNTSDPDTVNTVEASDIEVGEDSVVIKNAGAKGYGLIGSDITFRVNNGTKTGEAGFYVVKGEAEYETAYMFKEEISDEDFDDWKMKSDDDSGSVATASSLAWIANGKKVLGYDEEGNIYTVVRGDKESGDYVVLVNSSQSLAELVLDYSESMGKKNALWKLRDTEEAEIAVIGAPVAYGDYVYELLHVQVGYRESTMLLRLNTVSKSPNWEVMMDTLSDIGDYPDDVDVESWNFASFAIHQGKMYILGGIDDEGHAIKTVYSANLASKGVTIEKDTDLPVGLSGGYGVSSNGKLYYVLGTGDSAEVNYDVYAFDGSVWEKAGELPKALNEELVEMSIAMFLMGGSAEKSVNCAVGIDADGIVFGGASFDGVGDTFRYNTTTNEVEPLGYTLWGNFSDRIVNGAVMGNKLYASYTNTEGTETYLKSIDLKSGYVNITSAKSGKGSGTITGTGTYVKGDKVTLTVTPSKGSYIYSITTSGANFKRTYKKATATSKKAQSTTITADKNAKVSVNFGKISTKVTLNKTSLKLKRGKSYRLKGSTDGTNSAVTWTSSNKKYATVSASGKVTIKKGAKKGKKVKITATSKENKNLKKTCTITIK